MRAGSPELGHLMDREEGRHSVVVADILAVSGCRLKTVRLAWIVQVYAPKRIQ